MTAPASEHTVLEIITATYDKLYQAEKKIADFILANPDQAVNLNVSELAESSGVSDATVIRFCKHLGYEGYYQVRLLLSRDIGRRAASLALPAREGSSASDIFQYIAESARLAASATDEAVYQQTTELLRGASMVHLVATGNTTSLSLSIGPRLERLGIRCTYSTLPEHYMYHINLGGPGEVVLAVSGSGTSKYVVKALELAREKGMKTVAVTGYQFSPVSRLADYLLLSAPRERSENPSMQISRLNEMMVLEVLTRILEHMADSENVSFVDSEMFLSETKL